MMKLNIAQRFYGGLLDLPNHPDASLRIAAEQVACNSTFKYRSVMANRPTPPRRKRSRSTNLPLTPAYKGHRA